RERRGTRAEGTTRRVCRLAGRSALRHLCVTRRVAVGRRDAVAGSHAGARVARSHAELWRVDEVAEAAERFLARAQGRAAQRANAAPDHDLAAPVVVRARRVARERAVDVTGSHAVAFDLRTRV